MLHELALACALEHSVSIKQNSPKADTAAPEFVNPVTRYLTYEKAFLAGELDPAFKDFNAWELRYVIDGGEPDALSAWGRQMMRNFRPEQTRGDYGWRYVRIVSSDVQYGSQNVPLDRSGVIEGRETFVSMLDKFHSVIGRRHDAQCSLAVGLSLGLRMLYNLHIFNQQ